MRMNAFGNAMNPHQGKAKKVLCVCSAGLLRSPTAAVVLSQEPYNYNTRACGISEEYALIPITDLLIHWADEIVFMQEKHADAAFRQFGDEAFVEKDIVILDIPDIYSYWHNTLVDEIKRKYEISLNLLHTEEL